MRARSKALKTRDINSNWFICYQVIDHNGSVVVSEYGNDRLSVFDG